MTAEPAPEAPQFVLRACGHRLPVRTRMCPYCSPPRLSAAPIVPLLAERIRQVGLGALSVDMATRLGMDARSLERRIGRLVDGTYKRVELHSADELAIGLGQSPQAIWQDEWDRANPVEPYGDEDFDF